MRLDQRDLERWGRSIGEAVETPVVIGLRGPLGAGKSVLARAVGEGAGVRSPMPSPTYNLLFRYPGRAGRSVVHLDLYRLAEADEVWELGWSELGAEGEIVLVEWPGRAGELMPADHWIIELSVPERDVLTRELTVERVGVPPRLPPFPLSVLGSGS